MPTKIVLFGCAKTKHYIVGGPTNCMDQNVGTTDKAVRTLVGAVFGIVAIAGLAGVGGVPELLSPVAGVFAIVLLGTAAMGSCGLYSVLGINTCSVSSK